MRASPEPGRGALRVALFIDGADWHAQRLQAALTAAGAEVTRASLSRCRFATNHPAGIAVHGFGDDLPDAVFVRTVAAGSFEAVTLRLGVLHALTRRGVPIWNSAAAIEACVDKAQTTYRLAAAGLPTPDTWALESRKEAAAIVAAETADGRPLVLKPLFGSQGRALKLVASPDDLPSANEVSGVFYLQRFEGSDPRAPGDASAWRDHRVLVSGGRALAGMIREGETWITNIRQGGQAIAWEPDAEARRLAEAAAAACGADYAGVDLIRTRDGGWSILEVNSMPAWSGLQSVVEMDLTAAIAGDFLAAVRRAKGLRPQAVGA
ncbi:RimK family alpha-L-glutamate ligase [Rhizobiales bacterium Sp-1]|uniref:RimK family alpha-L-glutamate ligase n=1 Tax=Segnochrobactrum spirostomi TaxID=2608987 RepID=A0A6A7XXU9_9HYPH|nr:RimK family alpha-L-glutamate ligase [Segnochrobactrum spirostomi]